MLRTVIIVSTVILCHAVAAAGQEIRENRTTTAPSQARFEILQAEPQARLTYRLDRYTGRVDQLSQKAGESLWQEMDVPNRAVVSVPTAPRFRLFTSHSNIIGRLTLLLDTETGQTWKLTAQTWTPLSNEP
jgi:hypothetical protein